MKLIFATQNQHKAREIQAIVPKGIEVLTLKDIQCEDDIPETALTLEGNASLKSLYVVSKFGVNCFADDTGLEVEALDGRPGVFSARYAGSQKNADDNMQLVLSELSEKTNKKARFRTVISLIIEGEEHLFEGIVEGTIIDEKRGAEGFGYDTIFMPENESKTFAEMSLEEKNRYSHRVRALAKMIDFLKGKV